VGSCFNRLRLDLERGVLQIAAWSMWDRNLFASCSSRRGLWKPWPHQQAIWPDLVVNDEGSVRQENRPLGKVRGR